MSAPVLELRDVRKVYGSATAVETVSLALAEGEFLSLLGPSGSGKTTTLQMIAGLTMPTSGEILLSGRPIGPLPPYRRDIGMVFQNYALFPHMTVAGNIAFPLEMRGVAKAEIARKVEAVLALVELPAHADRYPRQLSGGQQQRVALARAIVFEPKLLLMDEPLGALDKQLREQMQIEIKHLHQRLGVSIIYVTHDQDEALVMSDRIAVFNAGRIEQIGLADELYERPATRFVAEFIGESNILPGRVVETKDGIGVVEAPAGRLKASSARPHASGLAALVSVRPERVHLARAPMESIAAENRFDGRIEEVIYMGRARKYVVAIAGGAKLIAMQQADGNPAGHFAVGEMVVASWAAGDAVMLEHGPRS